MLENMVPYVNLVLTTLAIMNTISIGSSQNELEHGLIKDCDEKSMKI